MNSTLEANLDTHWCEPLLKGEDYAGEIIAPTNKEQCNKFAERETMKVYVVSLYGVNYLSPYEKEEFSFVQGVFASKQAAESAIASGDCGVANENSAHSVQEFEVLN